MDDSDEYFDDTIILDDAALASIQATEEKFAASLSQLSPTTLSTNPQSSVAPPPAKRIKISHDYDGLSGGNGNSRISGQNLHRMESMDVNVDIHFGPDGNYSMSTQKTLSTTHHGTLGETQPSNSSRNLVRRTRPVSAMARFDDGILLASQKRTPPIEQTASVQSRTLQPQENSALHMPSKVKPCLEVELTALKDQIAQVRISAICSELSYCCAVNCSEYSQSELYPEDPGGTISENRGDHDIETND